MRIASFIGLRFLRAQRMTRSISVITWISAAGVMLGVVALIITISVMNGFRENMVRAVLGATPAVRLMAPDDVLPAKEAAALRARLEALPSVRGVAPYFSRQAFVRHGGTVRAARLRGIDPQAEQNVSDLPDFLSAYDAAPWKAMDDLPPERLLGALAYPAPQSKPLGIVLGIELADSLELEQGDMVEVISTETRVTPIGPVPLVKRFQVVGFIRTGIPATDEGAAIVDYRIAQKLFRMGQATTGLAVGVHDIHGLDLEGLRAAAQGGERPLRLLPWSEENRNIFQVMKLEKVGVFLILTLIIVVAFFNIISSLVMLVLEKRKAIAVLKSLGASNGLMRRVFFMQGVWIGAVGTLSGLSLGLLGCWVLATFDIIRIPQGVFVMTDRLPVKVELLDLALVTGSSFLICMLATLYPASTAARTHPVENLRHG